MYTLAYLNLKRGKGLQRNNFMAAGKTCRNFLYYVETKKKTHPRANVFCHWLMASYSLWRVAFWKCGHSLRELIEYIVLLTFWNKILWLVTCLKILIADKHFPFHKKRFPNLLWIIVVFIWQYFLLWKLLYNWLELDFSWVLILVIFSNLPFSKEI